MNFTGQQIAEDWEESATQYHDLAMAYLTRSDGLIAALKTRLITGFSATAFRSKNNSATRATDDLIDLVEDGIPAAAIVAPTAAEATELVVAAFAANAHRVNNWSGRLVELANLTLRSGVDEGSSVVEGGRVQATEWFVEWVNVGDTRMCPTCERLGAEGFVPLRSLETQPGGATECRARCRCVLVLWTRAEVEGGSAVALNDVSPR